MPRSKLSMFLGACCAEIWFVVCPTRAERRPGVRVNNEGSQVHFGLSCFDTAAHHNNDPSAGSPTETLLRLLLPLNDKVQWTSRDVAGSEPPTSPRSKHFTGPSNR